MKSSALGLLASGFGDRGILWSRETQWAFWNQGKKNYDSSPIRFDSIGHLERIVWAIEVCGAHVQQALVLNKRGKVKQISNQGIVLISSY